MPRTTKQHNRNQRRWDADFMDTHCEYAPFECSTMIELIAEGREDHIDHMITQLRAMKRLIKRRAKLGLSMPAWTEPVCEANAPDGAEEPKPSPEEPKPEPELASKRKRTSKRKPKRKHKKWAPGKPEPKVEPQEFESDEDSSNEEEDDQPVYTTKPGMRFGVYYKSKAERRRREKSLAERLKIIVAENRAKARAERIRAGWGKMCHDQLIICRWRLDQAKSRTGKYWEEAVLWWSERVKYWDGLLNNTQPPDIIEMCERAVEQMERAAEDHNERLMEDKYGSNWEEHWKQDNRARQRRGTPCKPEAERVFRELGHPLPSKYGVSDIKKAFRKLALVHHPDKGGDQEKFKRLHAAFETLMGA